MSASLAIVAEAPARAGTPPGQKLVSSTQRNDREGGGDVRAENHGFALPSRFPPVSSFIASYVPK
jgi:hypothetical protein